MSERNYTQGQAANDLLQMLSRSRDELFTHPVLGNLCPYDATCVLLRLLEASGHGAIVELYREVMKYMPYGRDWIDPRQPWIVPDTTTEIGCVRLEDVRRA